VLHDEVCAGVSIGAVPLAIVAEMVKICGGLVSLPSGLDLLAEDFLRLLQRDPDVDLMTVEKVPDAG
jgi:hypothetical protein